MIYHILPKGDLIEHDEDELCVCGPSAEWAFREGEFWPCGILVVHHSLDGRELEVTE